MNKNNNKKIGLRSARMRQLGMRQSTPVVDSFQAVTVTIPSSTPPITTLTLTANNIYPSTSKSNSYLYKEKKGFVCDPRNIYFLLSTDIYENKDNINNIKNIIISVPGKSTSIKFSGVEYMWTESLSSFFFTNKEDDKKDKYVFRVKVHEQNLSNDYNGYYYTSSVYGITGSFTCEYTKLAFSLSSFNPL